jgi:hypothetical protein
MSEGIIMRGTKVYKDWQSLVNELEAENKRLREAALLYSSDIGHSHACKATSKTVGVCICGYDALAALLKEGGDE